MPTDIVRDSTTVTEVTFTTSTGTTGGFSLGRHAGATLYVTSGTATLTFYAKPTSGTETAYASYADGSAVTLAVAPSRSYAIPDSLFAAGYVMATTSTGSVVATVTMKG